MKEGDAVRVTAPGEAYDLIGHITNIDKDGGIWVFLRETADVQKFAAKDLVAVRPQL